MKSIYLYSIVLFFCLSCVEDSYVGYTNIILGISECEQDHKYTIPRIHTLHVTYVVLDLDNEPIEGAQIRRSTNVIHCPGNKTTYNNGIIVTGADGLVTQSSVVDFDYDKDFISLHARVSGVAGEYAGTANINRRYGQNIGSTEIIFKTGLLE